MDPLSVDDEDEDDGELLETSDAYAVKPTLEDDEGDQNPSRVKLRENDGNGEDCDVAQIRRQQKLTDKYIEGEVDLETRLITSLPYHSCTVRKAIVQGTGQRTKPGLGGRGLLRRI